MTKYKQKVGNFGQMLAKKYLINKGYEIIAEHYYIKGGEIDLIVRKRQKISFVEVKTRTSEKFGQPEDAVNKYKLQALVRASEAYLREKIIYDDCEVGIDVIGVFIFKEKKFVKIKHFKDIDPEVEVILNFNY